MLCKHYASVGKQRYVINTILATSEKRSNIFAAMNKVRSISAKISSKSHFILLERDNYYIALIFQTVTFLLKEKTIRLDQEQTLKIIWQQEKVVNLSQFEEYFLW